MTTLAALGALWRWCSDDLRGFSFENFDGLYQVVLDHYDTEIDGDFSHKFRGESKTRALMLAAEWARKQMGEGL